MIDLDLRVSEAFEELRSKRRENSKQREEIEELRQQLKQANSFIEELQRTNRDLLQENKEQRTLKEK
jgi:TolA-binding protein